MHADERSRGVQQVERVSKLDILGAVFLADVECRTDLLHLFLCAERPQTLELGIMKGQTDGDDLGEQIYGRQGTVVVVDVVDVNARESAHGGGDGLVPCRVEDCRAEVVHAGWVGIGLGLRPEHGAVQDDPGNVVQHVRLDLDQVRLAEYDDFDGFGGVARGVLYVLDLGDDPDEVHVRHRLAHQRRHDTETADLDLRFPVEDLVLEGRDQHFAALFLVFGPTDDLARHVPPEELLSNWCVAAVPEIGRGSVA